MELISRLMPSPGHTNSGSTNCAGLRWVSRTRLRIDSETRKRRRRWIGNGINRIVTPGTGGDAAGNPGTDGAASEFPAKGAGDSWQTRPAPAARTDRER